MKYREILSSYWNSEKVKMRKMGKMKNGKSRVVMGILRNVKWENGQKWKNMDRNRQIWIHELWVYKKHPYKKRIVDFPKIKKQ